MGQGLDGKRIAMTRTPAQAVEIRAALAEVGAELVPISTIRILPPADAAPLREAAAHLERYDWIVLTSSNAGRAVAEVRRPPWPATLRVAAIGRGTAASMERLGVTVALVPQRENGAGLLAELSPRVAGGRVLFPRSSLARRTVPDGLEAAGATVEPVEAYRTVTDPDGARRLIDALTGGSLDALILTSPSSVHALVEAAAMSLEELIGDVAVVSVGPITTHALEELGRPPSIEAVSPQPAALIEALASVVG